MFCKTMRDRQKISQPVYKLFDKIVCAKTDVAMPFHLPQPSVYGDSQQFCFTPLPLNIFNKK